MKFGKQVMPFKEISMLLRFFEGFDETANAIFDKVF
jgi:hypothetical protein